MEDLIEPLVCDECGCDKLTKAGTRKTKMWGKIRKYQCTECGHYMSNSPGIHYMESIEYKKEYITVEV